MNNTHAIATMANESFIVEQICHQEDDKIAYTTDVKVYIIIIIISGATAQIGPWPPLLDS
jgi:hypothetical protein